MPRITVTADSSAPNSAPLVLLDEHVRSVHLDTDHAAAQLVERLAWAIIDAEDAETPARDSADPPVAQRSQGRARRRPARSLRRIALFSGVG